jgi:hypothetical protein
VKNGLSAPEIQPRFCKNPRKSPIFSNAENGSLSSEELAAESERFAPRSCAWRIVDQAATAADIARGNRISTGVG